MSRNCLESELCFLPARLAHARFLKLGDTCCEACGKPLEVSRKCRGSVEEVSRREERLTDAALAGSPTIGERARQAGNSEGRRQKCLGSVEEVSRKCLDMNMCL